MIHDHVDNFSRYSLPGAGLILEFLRTNPVHAWPLVEHAINGRELFVRPAAYSTRLPEEGRFEVHQLYMDVQYVISGVERMQSVPADALLPATAYDPVADIQFFTADHGITDVCVKPGEFVVYFPGEAHRPMCQRGSVPELVKKLVFKIKIS